jgi:hypothetical protein
MSPPFAVSDPTGRAGVSSGVALGGGLAAFSDSGLRSEQR